MAVPKYDQMFEPLLKCLNFLGCSSIADIEVAVGLYLKLSEKDLSEISLTQQTTNFKYRLAWARFYLKESGYVVNPERGIWVTTKKGRKANSLNPKLIQKTVRDLHKKKKITERRKLKRREND